MWSIGAALLLEVVVAMAVIAYAARRLRAELEPTRRSMEQLDISVIEAVERVSRDTGRASAGRQLLLRRGNAAAPR